MPLRLRTEELSWREVDEEIVILDESTWKYVHLNGSATVLWLKLVDGVEHRSQLSGALTDTYPGLDATQADEDAESFVAALLERGYLADD